MKPQAARTDDLRRPRKRRIAPRLSALTLALAAAGAAHAGPGSVVIKTDGDITATFGGQVRMIPTSERNWDFGITKATGDGRFKPHANEGGTVRNQYVRTEDRLYFNFAKGDVWDVYMAPSRRNKTAGQAFTLWTSDRG